MVPSCCLAVVVLVWQHGFISTVLAASFFTVAFGAALLESILLRSFTKLPEICLLATSGCGLFTSSW